MPKLAHVLDVFLSNLGYPLLLIGGIMLHFFTAITAYQLLAPGFRAYLAGAGAFMFPGIAEIAVVFYARRATGSLVNAYSIWVLAWITFALFLYGLRTIRRNLARD
jgi:hypothetical protein